LADEQEQEQEQEHEHEHEQDQEQKGNPANHFNTSGRPSVARVEPGFLTLTAGSGMLRRTWTEPVVIARQPGKWLAYPCLFERQAGELWITTMQGRVRVRLNERDFTAKG
jgi:hypothetical protein